MHVMQFVHLHSRRKQKLICEVWGIIENGIQWFSVHGTEIFCMYMLRSGQTQTNCRQTLNTSAWQSYVFACCNTPSLVLSLLLNIYWLLFNVSVIIISSVLFLKKACCQCGVPAVAQLLIHVHWSAFLIVEFHKCNKRLQA